jgi:malate/lactate dehydrogenase
MNRKVTVVGGAGNVGATVARGIAEKELADVLIIDIADQKAAGVASWSPPAFRASRA